MSTFVLNRSYELQLPNSFVEVDCEEMEYVDGGFYISNQNLKAGLFAFMSASTVNALVASQAITIIANGVKIIAGNVLKWVGSVFGGFVGGVIGWAVGNFSGFAIGIQIGRALLTNKGINVSWDGLSVC